MTIGGSDNNDRTAGPSGAAAALQGPHGSQTASFLAEIVYDILTTQGVKFAEDPRPFIERIAKSVKKQLSPQATVDQALTATLQATCAACGLDGTFEP